MTSFGEVAERLRRSTVQVVGDRRTGSGGSGLIFDSNGLLVTNAHVLRGDTADVIFWDGARATARIVRCDRRADLAALQTSHAAAVSLRVAAGEPRPGAIAIAAGNPLGFIGAISTGVVHSVGPVSGIGRRRWIQTTVRLAPGSSGGPLADARGHLLGVNTMIVSGTGTSLALAIPISAVGEFLNNSRPSRRCLGVAVRPLPAGGLIILGLEPGYPAERSSLLIGDVIVGAGGQKFRDISDLQSAVETAPGGRLTLNFHRGGAPRLRSATVALEERSAAA